MKTFRITVDIHATPTRVWEIFLDVERWPQWTPSMTRLRYLSGAGLAAGSVVRISQPGFPDADWTVTDAVPLQCFTWVSARPGMIARASHRIEPAADGCVVTLDVVYEGLLSGIIGLLMQGVTRRFMAQEAAGLKQRCEQPAGPAFR